MAKQTNIDDWIKNFQLKRIKQNNCKVNDNVDLEPAENQITFNEFFEFSNACDLLSKDIREKYPDEEKQNEKLKNIAAYAKNLYDKYTQGRKVALLKRLEFKPRPWLTRRDRKLRRNFGVTKCERVDMTSSNIVQNIAKEVLSSIQERNPSVSNVCTQDIMCSVIMTLLGDRIEKYGSLDLAVQCLEFELSYGEKFKQELLQTMNRPCPKSRKLQLLNRFVNEFRSNDVGPLSRKIINVNKCNLEIFQSTTGHKECPKPKLLEDIEQPINADSNLENQQNEQPHNIPNRENPNNVTAKNVIHKCIEAEEASCSKKDLIRNSSQMVCPLSKKKFLGVEVITQERSNNTSMSEIAESNKTVLKVTSSQGESRDKLNALTPKADCSIKRKISPKQKHRLFKRRQKDLVYVDTDNSSDEKVSSLPETVSNEQLKTSQPKSKINRVENESRDYIKVEDIYFLLNNTNLEEIILEKIKNKFPGLDEFNDKYLRTKFVRSWCAQIPSEIVKCLPCLEGLKLNEICMKMGQNENASQCNQKHINRSQDTTCQSLNNSYKEKRLKELLLKSKTYDEFKKNTNVQEYMHNDIMRKYPDTYNKFLPKIEKFMKVYYTKHFLKGDIPMELKLKDANESLIQSVPEKVTRKKSVEEVGMKCSRSTEVKKPNHFGNNPIGSSCSPLVMIPDQTIDKVFVDCDQNRTSSQVNPEQDLTQINQSVNLFPSSGESIQKSGKKSNSNETISQAGKLQNDPLCCMNMGALPLQKQGQIVIDLISPKKESSCSRSNCSGGNNYTVVFTAPLKADLSTARNNNVCDYQICNRMNVSGEQLIVVSENSRNEIEEIVSRTRANSNSQICNSFLNGLDPSKLLDCSVLDDIDFISQSENLVVQPSPKQIKTELDFSRYSDEVEYVPNDVTTYIEIEDDAADVSNLLKEMMNVGTADKNNLFSPVKGGDLCRLNTFQTSQSNVTDFDPKLMPQSTQEKHVNTQSIPPTIPFQILEEIRILPENYENSNNVVETPVTENNIHECVDLLKDTSSKGVIDQQSNNGINKETRKRKADKTPKTVTKIPKTSKQSNQSEQCNKVAGYDLAPQVKHTFQPLKFRNEFVARTRRRKDHFAVDMLGAFRPKIKRSKNNQNNTDYFIEDVTQEIDVESESRMIGHSDMLNIDSSYFRSSQLENQLIVGQMYADTLSQRKEVGVRVNELVYVPLGNKLPQNEIICTEVPQSIIFAKEMSQANFVIEENEQNKVIESNNEQSNEIENELKLMRKNQCGVGSHISEEEINLKQLNNSNVVLAEHATHTEHASSSSLPSKYAGIQVEDLRIPEELSKTLCITLREAEYSPESNSVNKESVPSTNEVSPTNVSVRKENTSQTTSHRDVCTKNIKPNETLGQIPSQTERTVETCDLQSSNRNVCTAEATSTVTDEQGSATQEAAYNSVKQHVATIQSQKPSPPAKPVYMILCEAEYLNKDDSVNNVHCEERTNEQSIPGAEDGSSSMQTFEENNTNIVQNSTTKDNAFIQLDKGPLVLTPFCITLCQAEYDPDENSESNEAPKFLEEQQKIKPSTVVNENLKMQSDVGNEPANSSLSSVDNQEISKQAVVFRPLDSTQSEPVYVPDSSTDRMFQSQPNQVETQEDIEEKENLQVRETENTEKLGPPLNVPTDSSTDRMLESQPNHVETQEDIEENENLQVRETENTEKLGPRLDMPADSLTDRMLQSQPNQVEMQEDIEEHENLQVRKTENTEKLGPPLNVPTDSSTDRMLESQPNHVETQEDIEENENLQVRETENTEKLGPPLNVPTDSSTDRILQSQPNQVEMQEDIEENENTEKLGPPLNVRTDSSTDRTLQSQSNQVEMQEDIEENENLQVRETENTENSGPLLDIATNSSTDRTLQSQPNQVEMQDDIEENENLQVRETENAEKLGPPLNVPTDSSTDRMLQSLPNEVEMQEDMEESENTEKLGPPLNVPTDSSTDRMLQSLPNEVEMQEAIEENENLQVRETENTKNSGPPLDIATNSSADRTLQSQPNQVEMQEDIEENDTLQVRETENTENSGPPLDIATDSSTERTLQSLSNGVEVKEESAKSENLQYAENEDTDNLLVHLKVGLDLDTSEQRNVYKKNPRDKFHQRTMVKKLETIQEHDNEINLVETVPQPSVSPPRETRIDSQVVAKPQQVNHICSASCSSNLKQKNANIPKMVSNYRYGHITYLSLSKVRLMSKVDHLRYESKIPFLMPFEKHHMQAVIDFRNGPHHKLNFCGDSLRVLLGLSSKEWLCILNLLNHIETFEYTVHDDEPHDRSLFHRILYYLFKTLPKFCQVTFEYDVTNINYSTSCTERRRYRKPFRCLSQAFSNEILETMAKVKRSS